MAYTRRENGKMTKEDNVVIYTTIEAAKFLKIPAGSLRNMIWRGEIKPLKCGRLNRFTQKCLLEFLNQKR